MEKGPLSCYNYKGWDSSFNNHSTRRKHEDGHNMSLGTDVHVERLPNILPLFCSLFGGVGREWASNIADYHVWPVEYHDFGPYCC